MSPPYILLYRPFIIYLLYTSYTLYFLFSRPSHIVSLANQTHQANLSYPAFQRSGVGIPRSVAIPSSSSLGTTVPIPPYIILYPASSTVTRKGPKSPAALESPQRAPYRAPSAQPQWGLHEGWAWSSTRIFFAQLFQKLLGYTLDHTKMWESTHLNTSRVTCKEKTVLNSFGCVKVI